MIRGKEMIVSILNKFQKFNDYNYSKIRKNILYRTIRELSLQYYFNGGNYENHIYIINQHNPNWLY